MRMMRTLAILGLFVSACGSGSDLTAGYGRLTVALSSTQGTQTASTATSGDGLAEIIVTIGEVTAHSSSSGWVTLRSEPLTIDINELENAAADLGFADLPTSTVTQIRLQLVEGSESHVTLADGSEVALKVPSGEQSGIKIHGPWNISGCTSTNVTLNLERNNAIHVHPAGDRHGYILRPVIHAGAIEYDVDESCVEDEPQDSGSVEPNAGNEGSDSNDSDNQPNGGSNGGAGNGSGDGSDPDPGL